MSLMMYGNDLKYLANGNLITDADRGISVIKYNILNLPDTIQFVNGNQLVNLYDASGRKYKSIVYTNIATAVTPCYEIAHYTSTMDSVEYRITEYANNVEYYYTSRDTTSKIFNASGYYSDSTYYHYIKDHLGNICAVVHSIADSAVQSTKYYASGVPMAESTGRDQQPYLYNGKEFMEAHGLNEYDSQARHYYATIMRTTTMDPMAEKYYHISPYAWCGNNTITNIDKNGQYYFDWDDWCYRSSYGNHEEVDWVTIQANNYVEPAPTKELTPLHAVAEFIAGSAPAERIFTDGDIYTQQFRKNNPRLQNLIDNISQQIFESGQKYGDENYDLGENGTIKRAGLQVLDLITALGTLFGERVGSMIGNVAASTIGSFDLHWELERYDNDGNAVISIKMTNPMSAGSLLKPSMSGYSDFWRNNNISSKISAFFNSDANKSGMMHTVNMTMTWTETIPNPNKQ